MILRFILAVILGSFGYSYAQQLDPVKYQHLPPHLNLPITEAELASLTDSLQKYASFRVRGHFKAIDLKNREALYESLSQREWFTWQLRHPSIQSRVYVSVVQTSPLDSLYVFDANGYRRESLHLQSLPSGRYCTLPLASGQYIRLSREKGSQVSVHLYGLTQEPLPALEKLKKADFGDSGPCQVNVNCSEGTGYNDVQNSVVRILVKVGSTLGFCSGSMINNTLYDYTPYLLTAEHCGIFGSRFVTSTDLEDWVFYFNYSSDGCSSPVVEGNLAQQQMVGAELLANSDDNGGDRGSDFFLLRLLGEVPAEYNAYYAGWNRKGNDIPQRGATIHHPAGDIKKISTYAFPASSGSFDGQVEDSHWLVQWVPTPNGHGTTEGGSSGCPLYDANFLIRGVLTGGSSSCSSPNGQDYFGKFSYSWESNGTVAERRLKDWLDPNNTGFLALGGSYQGDSIPSASLDFTASPNPVTHGILQLKNLGQPTDDLQLLIFDITGKVLYNQRAVGLPGAMEKINVLHWRNGLYTVALLRNTDVITRKVLILN